MEDGTTSQSPIQRVSLHCSQPCSKLPKLPPQPSVPLPRGEAFRACAKQQGLAYASSRTCSETAPLHHRLHQCRRTHTWQLHFTAFPGIQKQYGIYNKLVRKDFRRQDCFEVSLSKRKKVYVLGCTWMVHSRRQKRHEQALRGS